MPLQEAVIEGGRRRLRPILMTALATIFALLPMAVGIAGGGGFISQPLAVVVIGGLISSTVLTLVLVPTLYTMVENRKERARTRAGRDEGSPSAPEEKAGEPVPAGHITVDVPCVPVEQQGEILGISPRPFDQGGVRQGRAERHVVGPFSRK